MSPDKIKNEKLKEIFKQLSQGISGLYNLWNYIEDLHIDESEKENLQCIIETASNNTFTMMGYIHVLNESWKLPGGGHVPLK